MPRPFRFALTIGSADNLRSLVDTIRRAEDAGFAVLAGVDHIGPPLGVLPLLATVAQLTSLRVSPMVIANDYRHPVQLARDVATIDLLSEGRVELGIGTGWIEEQYRTAGIPFDAPGVRVSRLEEAIAVIKGCWTGQPFAYSGRHYRVDLTGHPQPVQRPHPPILIAGSGPRMLELAGREADIVGITVTRGLSDFGSFGTAVATSAQNIDRQIAAIERGAAGRGADLELSVMIHHHFASDSDARSFAARAGVDDAVARRSPHALIGPTGQMVEMLLALRERHGLSYIVIRGPDLDVMAPVVEKLAGR